MSSRGSDSGGGAVVGTTARPAVEVQGEQVLSGEMREDEDSTEASGGADNSRVGGDEAFQLILARETECGLPGPNRDQRSAPSWIRPRLECEGAGAAADGQNSGARWCS